METDSILHEMHGPGSTFWYYTYMAMRDNIIMNYIMKI